MWKSRLPDADSMQKASLLDRYFFGRFAILSRPQVLTDEGREARKKTIAGMKMLGLGVVLVIVAVPLGYVFEVVPN
jgi:hypothetical protein